MEQAIRVRRAEFYRRQEEQYTMLMKGKLSQIPEPRRDDPDQRGEIRSKTLSQFAYIDNLEREQRLIRPDINPGIETKLLDLRIERDLLYWRIFRIDDLAPEILVNIFRYVVWSIFGHDRAVQVRLWLTWVCRRWRAVAISDFTLWDVIWFRETLSCEQSLTWLERSGTAPLDLYIHEQDPSFNEDDKHRFTIQQMDWLFDRMLSKLSQIRVLVVIVETWPPALMVLDKIRHASATATKITMERFELHRNGSTYVWIGPGYQPDTHRNPIPLFNGIEAPMLKTITLNGVSIDWAHTPLANLTTIDIRRIPHDVSPNLTRFRDFLRSSPNLHKLFLDGAGPTWEERDPSLRPIKLPKLTFLMLGNLAVQYAMYTMENIYAPNVRDLTLSNMTGEDYAPLIALITPVTTEVRILTLCAIELDTTQHNAAIFNRWLHSMPHVGFLRISSIQRHILGSFLRVRPSTSGAPLVACPKLKAIEFKHMDWDIIVAFVSRRNALNVPLQSIYVNEVWSPQVIQTRVGALRNVAGRIIITPDGMTTEEEEELMPDETT